MLHSCPHLTEALHDRRGNHRRHRGTGPDVAPDRRGRPARRGAGPERGRRRAERRGDAGAAGTSAPSRTTARTRAVRSARDRSRRACCAARGTATTTTRSPAVPPEGFADAVPSYDVEERDDGVYVALPDRARPTRTVADVLVETLVAYGVTRVLRHGRALQPRLRRRAAPGRGARRDHATSASATRARRRSRRAPTASSPGGRPPASRSPGRARPTCSPACTTPSSTGSPVIAISGQVPVEGAGPRGVPGPRPVRGLQRRRRQHDDRARRQRPRRAGRRRGEARARRTRCRPPGPPRRGAGAARRERRAALPTGAVATGTQPPAPAGLDEAADARRRTPGVR